jgi:hypothetical protein
MPGRSILAPDLEEARNKRPLLHALQLDDRAEVFGDLVDQQTAGVVVTGAKTCPKLWTSVETRRRSSSRGRRSSRHVRPHGEVADG